MVTNIAIRSLPIVLMVVPPAAYDDLYVVTVILHWKSKPSSLGQCVHRQITVILTGE